MSHECNTFSLLLHAHDDVTTSVCINTVYPHVKAFQKDQDQQTPFPGHQDDEICGKNHSRNTPSYDYHWSTRNIEHHQKTLQRANITHTQSSQNQSVSSSYRDDAVTNVNMLECHVLVVPNIYVFAFSFRDIVTAIGNITIQNNKIRASLLKKQLWRDNGVDISERSIRRVRQKLGWRYGKIHHSPINREKIKETRHL